MRSVALRSSFIDAPPSTAVRLIATGLLFVWPKNAIPGGDVLLPYIIHAIAAVVLWIEFRLIPFRFRRLRAGHVAVGRLLRWERRTAGWLCAVAGQYRVPSPKQRA